MMALGELESPVPGMISARSERGADERALMNGRLTTSETFDAWDNGQPIHKTTSFSMTCGGNFLVHCEDMDAQARNIPQHGSKDHFV